MLLALSRLRLARPTVRLSPGWLLVPWCAFLFLYGTSSGTLYRTEALRAIIGRECLNGHWLVPTLYGEPFLTKPPGMYAAIALASLPFGDVTDVSSRLPSAFAAMLTVFVMFLAFRHAFGERVATWAAAVAPVSLLWLDKAPSAEIDMLQVAWVAVAMFAFWRATESPTPTRWWLAAMLAVTCGFLTKWTAPAFFYLAAVPYLALNNRLSLLFSRGHLIGIALGIAIVGAWVAVVVASVGWPVLADTVGAEAMQRFDPNRGGRAYPVGEVVTFPLAVFAGNLPWAFLALWTLRPSFWRMWDERGRSLLLLFHCWTWPNVLFWTVLPEHAVRYVFPVTPAITGLGIMAVVAFLGRAGLRERPECSKHRSPTALNNDGRSSTLEALGALTQPRSTKIFVALLVGWMIVKVAYVEVVMPGRTDHRRARETATSLRDSVPAGATLHLFRLKDEGIMFYYGRPAHRLTVAPTDRTVFAVLTGAEWRDRAAFGVPVRFVNGFLDQQGDWFALAKMGNE